MREIEGKKNERGMKEREREREREGKKKKKKKKLIYLTTIIEKNARAFWCGSPRVVMGIYQSYHWKGMLCEMFYDGRLIYNILKLIHLIHCSCFLGSYDFSLVIANFSRIRI